MLLLAETLTIFLNLAIFAKVSLLKWTYIKLIGTIFSSVVTEKLNLANSSLKFFLNFLYLINLLLLISFCFCSTPFSGICHIFLYFDMALQIGYNFDTNRIRSVYIREDNLLCNCERFFLWKQVQLSDY